MDAVLRKIKALESKTIGSGCTPEEVNTAQKIARKLRSKVDASKQRVMSDVLSLIKAKGLYVNVKV